MSTIVGQRTWIDRGIDRLVPIIPHEATLSPYSSVSASQRGKVPGKPGQYGWTGLPEWPQKDEPWDADTLRKWQSQTQNLGVHARWFPALDFDTNDSDVITAVTRVLDELLEIGNGYPRRGRGGAERHIVPFRRAGQHPVRSWQLKLSRGAEDIGLIEFLGDGDQWLLEGIHPSGETYVWSHDEWAADDLTGISNDGAVWLAEAIVGALTAAGVDGRLVGRVGSAERVEQATLLAPSDDAAEALLRRYPNSYDHIETRLDWITHCHAVCAMFRDKGRAQVAWLAWCAQVPQEIDPDVEFDKAWRLEHRVGWSWLCKRARAFGFIAAQWEFSAELTVAEVQAVNRIERWIESDTALPRRAAEAQKADAFEQISEGNVVARVGTDTVVVTAAGWSYPGVVAAEEPVVRSLPKWRNHMTGAEAIEIKRPSKKSGDRDPDTGEQRMIVDRVNPVELWLNSSTRPRKNRVIFHPLAWGESSDPRVNGLGNNVNLWTGFAYEPEPGNLHERFLEHLYENVCHGEDEHFRWLLAWYADPFQFPRADRGSVVILTGPQGTGKSRINQILTDLHGRRHGHFTSSDEDITNNFNAHMSTKLFVALEEATWGGDVSKRGRLKDFVTGSTLRVERKGIDVDANAPNYARVAASSNEDRAWPAEFNERRGAYFRVGTKQMDKRPYFTAMQNELNAGGYNHLMHHLVTLRYNRDMLHATPETNERTRQIEANLGGPLGWWLEVLTAGVEPRDTVEDTQGRRWWSGSDLYSAYETWAGKRRREEVVRPSQFWGALSEVGVEYGRFYRPGQGGGGQHRGRRRRSLVEFRKIWGSTRGGRRDWGEGWREDEWARREEVFG